MTESERRQILDQIARSIHAGNDPETYQASVDQLVDDGMSLETIEAEVNDRRARIQTDEEVDNLRQSVKRKGLLFGCLTAGLLLLLSVAASYALISYVAPALEPTPMPEPSPTAVPTYAAGHWRFFVDAREAQGADGEETQAVVTVFIVDKDGAPAPDGIEARLRVDQGAITPEIATTREGVVTALYAAQPDAQAMTLTVGFMNDEITRDITIAAAVAQVTETPTLVIPTPIKSPTATLETPVPIPTPTIEITMDWSPRWSDAIEVGVEQMVDLMITLEQGGSPMANATPEVETDPMGLLSIDQDGGESLDSDEADSPTVRLIASSNPGQGTLEVQFGTDVARSVQVAVLPIATINTNSVHLRTQPIRGQSYRKGGSSGPPEKPGSSYLVLGKHLCYQYDAENKVEDGYDCYLVKDTDGVKYWLEKQMTDPNTVTILPEHPDVPDASRNAAERYQLVSIGDVDVPILRDSDTDAAIIAEIPSSIELTFQEYNLSSEVVPITITLWVPSNVVSEQDAGKRQITNVSDDIEVCGYLPNKEPQVEDGKYCGILKAIDPAINAARDLDDTEKKDEADLGGGTWKLVVLPAAVRRNNIR